MSIIATLASIDAAIKTSLSDPHQSGIRPPAMLPNVVPRPRNTLATANTVVVESEAIVLLIYAGISP